MAKQVKNLLDALQPAAPSVNAFITTLRIGGKPQRESGGPSMFGEAFDDGAVEAIPPGSAGVQGCGAKLAIQFEALRNQLGAPPISLDIWFCELARFTLEPRALFENGAKQRECWTRRQAICEENGVHRYHRFVLPSPPSPHTSRVPFYRKQSTQRCLSNDYYALTRGISTHESSTYLLEHSGNPETEAGQAKQADFPHRQVKYRQYCHMVLAFWSFSAHFGLFLPRSPFSCACGRPPCGADKEIFSQTRTCPRPV